MAKKNPKNLLAHIPLSKLDKQTKFTKERIQSEKESRLFDKEYKKNKKAHDKLEAKESKAYEKAQSKKKK